MTKFEKLKITECITTLRDSCMEGHNGLWDCSSAEGKEGFLDMSDGLELLAKRLDITLDRYEMEKEQ